MPLLTPGTPTLKPAFRIEIDGTDYTDRFTGRLVALTLRDLRGMEADTLSLEVDDSDGRVKIPEKGAKIALEIGFLGDGGLRDKGPFVVDNVGHSGPPDRVHITAHSADFRGSLKIARERSWHGETLGSLVDWIAGDHTLAPAVAAELAAIQIPHIDQTNESDAHFLTRLAVRYDAIATVKHERLLFVRRGHGLTATGQPLPTVTLDRSQGDQHHYEEPDRESRYTEVKAFYDDPRSARRLFAVVGAEGYLRTLRDPFPSEAEARSAAEGEWGRVRRALAGMEITLARGRPDVIPDPSSPNAL
jgi:phage protein D